MAEPSSGKNATNKPVLHVEVQLKSSTNCDPFVRTDNVRNEVRKWLLNNFMSLRVGDHLHDLDSLQCKGLVDAIKIASYSRPCSEGDFHELSDLNLDIHVYSLAGDVDEDAYEAPHGEDDETQFTVMTLPHKSFDGLWESLIYSENIPEGLLRILMRAMKIVRLPHLDLNHLFWYNLVLLYGPPGSGKTSLAQALAQKLAIRLERDYSAARLIEVNSHTLLSRWFGESGKLVGKLFDTIRSISADETLLTIVMIDEVETLAGSRTKASKSNECLDGIRATNELLQGLDKFRKRPNVVFICTSNLVDSLDDAFMDRCGIKQFIGTPSCECAYQIFRSVINEFIKNNLVVLNSLEPSQKAELHHYSSDPIDHDSTVGSTSSSPGGMHHSPAQSGPPSVCSEDEGLTYVPSASWMTAHLWNRPRSAPRRLWAVSAKAWGLSGRALRRLPLLALTKYTVDEPCDLHDLLVALEKVVEGETRNVSAQGDQKERHHVDVDFAMDEEDIINSLNRAHPDRSM